MNKSESKYFNTALLMNQALIEILNKKEYEFITIKEICIKAGVNRSTFYLHYDNIEDLFYETLENIDKKFISYFEESHTDVTERIRQSPKDNLIFISPEYLKPYLQYVKDNKAVYQVYVRRPQKMRAQEKFNSLNRHILFPIFKRFGIEENRYDYFSAYYINGVSAIINEWIKRGCADETDYVCKVIIDCVRPYIDNDVKREN